MNDFQLEDLDFALQAALKARKSAESEVSELQVQLDDVTRIKGDLESRCVQKIRVKLVTSLDDSLWSLLKVHSAQPRED